MWPGEGVWWKRPFTFIGYRFRESESNVENLLTGM
jgi:hypothetical protein